MADELRGKRIAILATDGFEQVELTEPKKALEAEGARVDVVSPESGSIKGWDRTDWGEEIRVDRTLDDASADHYDALVLPGGQINPDKLRAEEKAVNFARAFADSDKPIAAICHGPWLLIEADLVRGRRATSYHSIKTDMRNAGAKWVDEEVVNDNGLITSRNPDDIPAFNREMIRVFARTPEMQVW